MNYEICVKFTNAVREISVISCIFLTPLKYFLFFREFVMSLIITQ